MISPITTVLFLSACVSAHFRIPVPGERNATNWDTQTTGPCGGSNLIVLPRFEFNPKGSPIQLFMHHALSVGEIRFCPGSECHSQADFSVQLFSPFEQTGAGNFCIPALTVPGVVGTNGTIQVTYLSLGDARGEYESMFNCLDITVSDSGVLFSNQCANTSADAMKLSYLDLGTLVNATDISVLDAAMELDLASPLSPGLTSIDPMCTMAGMENMPGMNCPLVSVSTAGTVISTAVSSGSHSGSATASTPSSRPGSSSGSRSGSGSASATHSLSSVTAGGTVVTPAGLWPALFLLL